MANPFPALSEFRLIHLWFKTRYLAPPFPRTEQFRAPRQSISTTLTHRLQRPRLIHQLLTFQARGRLPRSLFRSLTIRILSLMMSTYSWSDRLARSVY